MSLPTNPVSKYATRRGRVNGDPALIAFPSRLWDDLPTCDYAYARIPAGYQLEETETEYVGLRHTQTGEARELVWEAVPVVARIALETTLP